MIEKLKKFVKKSFLKELNLRKSKRSFGYVESISPNLITGWVLDKKARFVGVRLINDNQILASAPIDIHREDVNSKFNYKNPSDLI